MLEGLLCVLLTGAGIAYFLSALCAVQANAYRAPKGSALYKTTGDFAFCAVITLAGALAAVLAGYLPAAAYSVAVTSAACFLGVSLYYYSKRRTRYKLTPRGIRLLFAAALLVAALQTLNILFFSKNGSIYMAIGFAVLLLSPFAGVLASILLYPFESLNNARYIKDAKRRIDALPAVKIGITGSFGKTSCKNILAAMLGKKYKVVKTAGSYNTPMGICLTAKEIKGDEEVFIAEMGARRKGDIRALCEMVKPAYGIVTGTGNQHLGTFKSEENIYETKRELAEMLPHDGFAVFNGENKGSMRMSFMCPCDMAVVHITQKAGIHARNIRLTNAGSSFEVVGLGEPFTVTTRLLGRHNILNILMCAALAFRLGVPPEQIREAAAEVQPVPHRLELVENARAITIIDDSYNANMEGAGFAYEVLKQFAGRKVVFTQGIVELGRSQADINQALGRMAAEAADAVLLTGENASAIRKGLENAGFQGEIHTYPSLAAAQAAFGEVLLPGDVLLIQNDIP